MEKALQWWYGRKLRQLEYEAHLIREQLLQESFAMRRSLELSLIKSDKLAKSSHQKYLHQLENFHFTLKELSDRLSPPYIDEELPLALQYLVKKWQEKFPRCQFDLKLPSNWLQNYQDNNSIILNFLEELLRIQIPDSFQQLAIFINLKKTTARHKLEIIFTNKESTNLLPSKNEQEFKYLQKSFECLMSGSCLNISTENSKIWYFQW